MANDGDNRERQARELLQRMTQAAQEFADDLGLPAEDKYDLLQVMYSGRNLIARTTEASNQFSANEAPPKLLHELVIEFLTGNAQLTRYLGTFEALWERLAPVPLQELARGAGQPQLTGGVGVAGRDATLPAVIATIAWAVTTQPVSEESIAGQARARGCTPAISRVLARYLNNKLPPSRKT